MWFESMKRKLSKVCYGFFSTLANPTRLAILEKLSESDMNVTQLAQTLKQEQSMISHNLFFITLQIYLFGKTWEINDLSPKQLYC